MESPLHMKEFIRAKKLKDTYYAEKISSHLK